MYSLVSSPVNQRRFTTSHLGWLPPAPATQDTGAHDASAHKRTRMHTKATIQNLSRSVRRLMGLVAGVSIDGASESACNVRDFSLARCTGTRVASCCTIAQLNVSKAVYRTRHRKVSLRPDEPAP